MTFHETFQLPATWKFESGGYRSHLFKCFKTSFRAAIFEGFVLIALQVFLVYCVLTFQYHSDLT